MSNNDNETIDGTYNETLVYSTAVQKAIDEVFSYSLYFLLNTIL